MSNAARQVAGVLSYTDEEGLWPSKVLERGQTWGWRASSCWTTFWDHAMVVELNTPMVPLLRAKPKHRPDNAHSNVTA